ncbi:hypothetical protein Goarm_000487, partial [Gossypium armourianum]|nr:hypothetical protein [Gossypium armourianum]
SVQPFKLTDIANGYFLAKFQNSEDFERILSQGPWIIYGQYLIIQSWSIEFDSSQPFPSVNVKELCLMKEKRPDLEVREKSSDLVVGENSGPRRLSVKSKFDALETLNGKEKIQEVNCGEHKERGENGAGTSKGSKYFGIKTQGRKSELVNALGFTNLVKKVGKEGGPNLPTRLDVTGATGQSEVGCLLSVSDGATFAGNIKTDVKHVDGGKR